MNLCFDEWICFETGIVASTFTTQILTGKRPPPSRRHPPCRGLIRYRKTTLYQVTYFNYQPVISAASFVDDEQGQFLRHALIHSLNGWWIAVVQHKRHGLRAHFVSSYKALLSDVLRLVPFIFEFCATWDQMLLHDWYLLRFTVSVYSTCTFYK